MSPDDEVPHTSVGHCCHHCHLQSHSRHDCCHYYHHHHYHHHHCHYHHHCHDDCNQNHSQHHHHAFATIDNTYYTSVTSNTFRQAFASTHSSIFAHGKDHPGEGHRVFCPFYQDESRTNQGGIKAGSRRDKGDQVNW